MQYLIRIDVIYLHIVFNLHWILQIQRVIQMKVDLVLEGNVSAAALSLCIERQIFEVCYEVVQASIPFVAVPTYHRNGIAYVE